MVRERPRDPKTGRYIKQSPIDRMGWSGLSRSIQLKSDAVIPNAEFEEFYDSTDEEDPHPTASHPLARSPQSPHPPTG